MARLWRTALIPGRGEAYERFAREVSVPMFRQHAGFLGCIMSRTSEAGLVLTLWQDPSSVEGLAHSSSYAPRSHEFASQGSSRSPRRWMWGKCTGPSSGSAKVELLSTPSFGHRPSAEIFGG